MVIMQFRAITIFVARGRDIGIVIILFVLVVLGLACVFCPTPHSRYDFLSSSHRGQQILLLE